jgi:hypothetical protein
MIVTDIATFSRINPTDIYQHENKILEKIGNLERLVYETTTRNIE